MTPHEKLNLFEQEISLSHKKHEFFDSIYEDGTWDKIKNAVLASKLSSEEEIKMSAKNIINAINWQCRTIFSIDTASNEIEIMGYEDDNGTIIEDQSFKHPFSSLPGNYPVYNFLDKKD